MTNDGSKWQTQHNLAFTPKHPTPKAGLTLPTATLCNQPCLIANEARPIRWTQNRNCRTNLPKATGVKATHPNGPTLREPESAGGSARAGPTRDG